MTDKISIVLIHGAAYSHTTFNALVPYFKDYYVVTPDLPGHGNCPYTDSNLSIDCFQKYIEHVIQERKLKLENTVVVGHSLGGSIATFFPNCLSVVMIDISEEPALKTVESLSTLLRYRPSSFQSLEEAAKWYKRYNAFCKIPKDSMEGQLKLTSNGQYTWRVDLSKSEALWKEWFIGMDERFLACNNPLLILSERDHMDKKLLIASMQGKFQLKIFGNTSHSIQEDQPRGLAEAIVAHIEHITKLRQVISEKQINDVS